jgi:hypothetical protein
MIGIDAKIIDPIIATTKLCVIIISIHELAKFRMSGPWSTLSALDFVDIWYRSRTEQQQV